MPQIKAQGPASFLELQDDYQFWVPTLLRSFPRLERWVSADARHFEKSMIYRLRYLAHLVYGAAPRALDQLEIEWIWDEIVRRQLQSEALRAINQVGVNQTNFLHDRENFRPRPMNPWRPFKRPGQIGLIFLAMGWGFYMTYWLIFLGPVSELLARLWSLIK